MSLKIRLDALATRIAAEFKAIRTSKLDALAYTGADVLTKIKTVDGSGSGLDADLLDGYLEASMVKRATNSVTNNLGDPSVEEMALFHGQFTNKMRFFPATLQEESTNGTTWTTSTRASDDQLKDIMLGEGQTGGITAIPATQVGHYRLTWDAPGYCSLQAFYCYGSANGNSVAVKIEKYNTAEGWTLVTQGGIGGWPEHTYIPHTGIWFLNGAPQAPHHGRVRVTFSITSPTTYGFDLNAIEWFGGYPAGRRNVESYDRDQNVSYPAQIYAAGSKVWNQGNDGSGSGLDADLLDGYQPATAETVNTVVLRDANGYIRAFYYNSSRATENSAAESYLYDTGDGWMRKKTLANVRIELLTRAAIEAGLTFTPANINSPAFTGQPTAWTPSESDNSTRLATTEFVKAAITALINSSPAALDTLNELAVALGNDPNFATTITNALAGKYSVNGGQLLVSGHALGASSFDVELYAGAGTELVELSIRFHQGGRYYKQIRVRHDGFRFTEGGDNAYVDIRAAAIYSNENRVWDAGNFDPATKLGINAKAASAAQADLLPFNNAANVGGALQFMQLSAQNAAGDNPTGGWCQILKLGHGDADTYFNRTLAFDFFSNDIYTRKRVGSTTADAWVKLILETDARLTDARPANGGNADTLDGKHASEFAINAFIANQNAHGFIVGDAIKLSGSTWVKAQANSLANGGVMAMVQTVTDANNFKYITTGLLSGAYTAGVDYYSSTTLAGALMTLATPEVWTAGQVRQYIGTGVTGGLMIDIDAGDLIQASAFNDIFVTGMSFNNANRVLTLTRSASMPDLSIAIPFPEEEMCFEFRDITKGVAQTYVLDMKVSWPYTIKSIVCESDGTLTGVSVKINSTAVTGLSSLSVAAKAETTATAANVTAAGDVVTINTATSYTGTPALMRLKIKYQRI